jgi:hypothetical protein
MKRLIGLAAAALVAPAIGATMATTTAASGAQPTIATAGSHWTANTDIPSCENVHFLASHKFVGGKLNDSGTWTEPTHSTITITWTTGSDHGLSFKGTFNSGAGIYKGRFTKGANTIGGNLTPGTKSGC